MAISAEQRSEIISKFRTNDSDTGSPEVQVAVLTAEILELTEHMKANKHDFSSRRGLMNKVSKRSRLTRYLQRKDEGRYKKLIAELGLRK
ncbi:MAG: 30S ribosomal protein S15 [Phycisphaerales bacterium]